jgi:hypothetical protein
MVIQGNGIYASNGFVFTSLMTRLHKWGIGSSGEGRTVVYKQQCGRPEYPVPQKCSCLYRRLPKRAGLSVQRQAVTTETQLSNMTKSKRFSNKGRIACRLTPQFRRDERTDEERGTTAMDDTSWLMDRVVDKLRTPGLEADEVKAILLQYAKSKEWSETLDL